MKNSENKYRNPEGKFCQCSNPAVEYRRGDFVCGRCKMIEDSLYSINITLSQRLRQDRNKQPSAAEKFL